LFLNLTGETFEGQTYAIYNSRQSNGENIEHPTNGSTGQREKAPAEPVCLITLNIRKVI
jgi:hypothetical protein